MNRYWVSWVQKTTDFRPITDPPTKPVLGWWASGMDMADNTMICAVIEAKNEKQVRAIVFENWAEDESQIGAFRFCTQTPDNWQPNDRFPITEDWQRERFGTTANWSML